MNDYLEKSYFNPYQRPNSYLPNVQELLQIRNTNIPRKVVKAGCWWPMPVILATQEAEIRRSQFEVNPGN
jgi:hypothetical protein